MALPPHGLRNARQFVFWQTDPLPQVQVTYQGTSHLSDSIGRGGV